MKKIIERIIDSVTEGDSEKTEELSKLAMEMKLDPLNVIENGLAKGVRVVGDNFGKGYAFLPEIMMAAEAMKAGLKVLTPELKRNRKTRKTLGEIVIGTVQGDIHDIGKNIVIAMLEAAGFEVFDLGVDVPCQEFVKKVKQYNANILGLSVLLPTCLPEMKRVIGALKEATIRNKVKVMVGGAPVTQTFAEEIGADAYGEDAVVAVEKAKQLLNAH